MTWLKGMFVKMALPFVKRYAKATVVKEGDILQAKALYLYDTEGMKGIDRAFDATQLKFIELAARIPFAPDWLKKSIVKIVQEEGDALQTKVKKVAEKGGHEAVSKAFDLAQESICARIDSL